MCLCAYVGIRAVFCETAKLSPVYVTHYFYWAGARKLRTMLMTPIFQCCHAVIFSDSNSRIATLSLESTYIGMHLTINDSKNLCILPCLCHLPGLLKIPPFCSNDFPRKSSISIVPRISIFDDTGNAWQDVTREVRCWWNSRLSRPWKQQPKASSKWRYHDGPLARTLENRAISGAQKGVLLKIARLIEPIIVPWYLAHNSNLSNLSVCFSLLYS